MERKFSIDEIGHRLELALKPAEGPVIEEVLEHVSNHGVLRGPVDWVFKAWIIYVEYATRRIAEAFQLSEEERSQLLDFRDAMKRLLLKGWVQAKKKLHSIYEAIAKDTYRVEDGKLYIPDGTWMYALRMPIRGVSASARFPNLLKLPREKLELLQLGWAASDEGDERGRPFMGTTQPWQVIAWTAVRYGDLRVYVASANLTREGTSVSIHIFARGWRQKWSKAEAIDLVASHLRRGEWTPLLTMWLGDGKIRWNRIGRFEVAVAAKEPWRLGRSVGPYEAVIAKGKEAFQRLKETAGIYGMLLDLLRAHKWAYIEETVRRKRSIDLLREAYGQNNGEIPTEEFSQPNEPGAVAVAGVVMYLNLVHGNGGSLLAEYTTRDVGKALAVAERLESAGLRPNIVKSNANYVVYIGTKDIVKLAERDEAVKRAVALYLAKKAKNGTPRQREIAEKILKRHPIFSHLPLSSKPLTKMW